LWRRWEKGKEWRRTKVAERQAIKGGTWADPEAKKTAPKAKRVNLIRDKRELG